MLGHSVLFALATMATVADKDVASFYHGNLAVGQKFEIQTADCVYRGELVDRSSGQCQMASSADGKSFSAPRTMYLLGATAGPQEGQMLVLMHEVKVGMKMELGVGDLVARNRLVTGEVTAIRFAE